MARTLKQLQESIQNLIDQQGEDAPVAAFIFTQEDVFEMGEDNNPVHFPVEMCERVLDAVEGDYDYLYKEIFDCIETELQECAYSDLIENIRRERGLIEN